EMARATACASPLLTRAARDESDRSSAAIGGNLSRWRWLDVLPVQTDTDDMKRLLLVSFTTGVLLAAPASAYADLPAFWGVSTTPEKRSARGFAAGINLLILGFEFEYANTAEDLAKGAPGLTTGMINGLVQTPTSGTQFYLTAGGGFFRERLDGSGE